jgi:hypothetical protein
MMPDGAVRKCMVGGGVGRLFCNVFLIPAISNQIIRICVPDFQNVSGSLECIQLQRYSCKKYLFALGSFFTI